MVSEREKIKEKSVDIKILLLGKKEEKLGDKED